MENKDTNTDYQNVVRVGDQKWEIVETTFRIIFLFEIRIHYILYRVLKSHPPIYMFWKMAQEPPIHPPHHTEGGVRTMIAPMVADNNLLFQIY